jgi:macrolide-specific efflux system membrane fusion protein
VALAEAGGCVSVAEESRRETAGQPPGRAPKRGRPRAWIAAVVVLVVLVVVAAAAGAWLFLHRSGENAAGAATTQLVAASTGTVKETVSATGTIQPANQANLKFAQSGKVTAVGVKVGDTVTVGQTLATIDPTNLQAAVTLAQQQLTAAQAQLTAATAAANSGQMASANAQVTAAQSRLTAAQEALGQAALTSSIAGTVAAVNVSVGDSVTGGSTTSGSTGSGGGGAAGGGSTGSTGSTGSSGTAAASASAAQVVVIATNAWVVNATVGASDLAKLKNGMQAAITPTGGTQPIFGTVSTIGVIGTTSGSTSTFPVTIAVTGSPAGVYAGTTGAVVITVKQVPDVLTVPTSAIHEENGQTVVYQMKDGAQVSTPVTVGTVYGVTTQITTGLNAGDQVVVTSRTGRTSTGNATGGTGTTRSGTGGFGGFGGVGQGGGQAPGQAPGGAPAAPGGS